MPYSLPDPQRAAPDNVISIRELRAHCATCSMRELCLPVALGTDAMRELDELVAGRQRFKKGTPVFQGGDRFTALYAVRSGSCKTTVWGEGGREQVTGYHLMGDIIGFDAIGSGRHQCQAVALEDTEVCEVPFARLEELCRRLPPLQHNLHRLLSREILRDQNLLLVVGSMGAEERLATFLLNLSQRYRQRGYSSTEFVLRLTRRDIGSYLGMTLETVSRLFSRFQAKGLIKIEKSLVRILDLPGLKAMGNEHGS
jgi:CRP/FNR family transcriptional regulator